VRTFTFSVHCMTFPAWSVRSLNHLSGPCYCPLVSRHSRWYSNCEAALVPKKRRQWAWRNRGIAPCILMSNLALGTHKRSVFRPDCFALRRDPPLSGNRLFGPRVGLDAVGNRKFSAAAGIKPKLAGCPAHSLTRTDY
jgi:hypothetical protein